MQVLCIIHIRYVYGAVVREMLFRGPAMLNCYHMEYRLLHFLRFCFPQRQRLNCDVKLGGDPFRVSVVLHFVTTDEVASGESVKVRSSIRTLRPKSK